MDSGTAAARLTPRCCANNCTLCCSFCSSFSTVSCRCSSLRTLSGTCASPPPWNHYHSGSAIALEWCSHIRILWCPQTASCLVHGTASCMETVTARERAILFWNSPVCVAGKIMADKHANRKLDITLDQNLFFSSMSPTPVNSAILSCMESILSVTTIKTLISASVLSRIDYCYSLLAGCPKQLIHKLQKVQNNSARLICRTPKSDHLYISHPSLASCWAKN